jgi:hypothetical protein
LFSFETPKKDLPQKGSFKGETIKHLAFRKYACNLATKRQFKRRMYQKLAVIIAVAVEKALGNLIFMKQYE